MPRKITGTVDKTSAGNYRARVPTADGRRETVGVFETEKDAWVACATAIADLGLDGAGNAMTLKMYAERKGGFLERRRKTSRAWENVKTLWATHIASAPFYARPMKSIRREEVKRWVDGIRERRARQTTLNALYLLSSCLGAAVDERKLRGNPCAGIKLPREARTDDGWTYLQRGEPELIEAACSRDEWLMVAFAWGTGLRQGEQRSLLLRDVHVDGDDPHVVVRYGAPGKPTKAGKPRIVPLFGVALDAAREWLQRLPEYAPENKRGLMFPAASGEVRARSHFLGTISVKPDGKPWRAVDRWGMIVEEAGLGRRFRWHDLRHSCASWAVSGWWGHRWSLAEVQKLLGHHSVTMTERYAHLAQDALRDAARATGHDVPRPIENIGKQPQRVDSGSRRARGPRATFLGVSDERGRFVALFRDAVLRRDDRAALRAARALAGSVMSERAVLLAIEVLAGGPHAITRAIELAELLDDAEMMELPERRKAYA